MSRLVGLDSSTDNRRIAGVCLVADARARLLQTFGLREVACLTLSIIECMHKGNTPPLPAYARTRMRDQGCPPMS